MLCYSLLLMFQVAAGQLVCYITTCNWCFVLQFVIDVSVCNLLIGVLQLVTVCDWCFACKISTVLHTARVWKFNCNCLDCNQDNRFFKNLIKNGFSDWPCKIWQLRIVVLSWLDTCICYEQCGDVVLFVFDIKQPSLPTPLYCVLVSVSLFMALSTVFHFMNSRDSSPLSHSVLLVLFLPHGCISLWK